MSITLILFVLAAVLSLLAMVLHVIMIVQGFKTSVGWGLICLFVPLGSIIFAFAKFDSPKRMIWGLIFLLAVLGASISWGVASYQTAMAAVGAAETAAQGMLEVEAQINDLENIEDLQLSL